MKKILSLLLAALLLVPILAGCGAENAPAGGKITVVTTIFPLYDWVREIAGERAEALEIVMLLDNGVDLHSFRPSADDLVTISRCDLFLYVGGESDEWAEDALQNAHRPERVAVSLTEALGDRLHKEEVVEGMEAEEEGEEEEGEAYDEHIWLSLKNAAALCRVIAAKLGEIDEAGKEIYEANAEAYLAKLEALDEKYEEAVGAAKQKTLLFADRFPFRYLTDDYGLDYYAAFLGCSAESEASFETVRFLARKVDELGLGAVLTLEETDHRLAETVVASTKNQNAKILTMDSLQSTTGEDVKSGASYLSIMEKNLAVLKEALA